MEHSGLSVNVGKKKLVRIFVVLSRHKFAFHGIFHRTLKLGFWVFVEDWRERWFLGGRAYRFPLTSPPTYFGIPSAYFCGIGLTSCGNYLFLDLFSTSS